MGCTIPLLGLVISLVGAFCLSALAYIFPAIMEMCVTWPNTSVPTLCKDIFLLIFGIVGLVVGSGTAIYEMVLAMRKMRQGPKTDPKISIDNGTNFVLFM